MKFCLLGEKLSHSLSKVIHEEYMKLSYDLVELKQDELVGFVNGVRGGTYSGFNITIPYKKAIIPLLDEVDDVAAEIGAVNTVVNRGGKLKGYNTDIFGMKYMLDEAGIDLKGKNVLILGMGGTSETSEVLAKREGAKDIKKVGRTSEINYGNCYELTDTQVIINATPVGMYPHVGDKPIDVKLFKNLEGVVDCIYNPYETLLIKESKELGLKGANGLGMLVVQGLKAEELWLDKPIDNRLIAPLTEYLKEKLREW